ncbi:metal cation symporter ZIP14-like [Diadema antillarum]|uniref:metal cation symporter ZIP14-like n=1 Tax=Diadema antillarum TaxID=105358 RepID=UPI003A85392F
MEAVNGTEAPSQGPSASEVWGYGFLFVTIINVGAFAGVWVIPLMNKKIYKRVLMFLVSLAVGTLSGNAILCLIPQEHGEHGEEEGGHDRESIWKNMVILGGIYLFFNTERILKIIASRKRNRERFPSQPCVQVTAMHNLDSNPDRIGYKFTSPTDAIAMGDVRGEEIPEDKQQVGDGLPGVVIPTPSISYIKDAENGDLPSNGVGHNHQNGNGHLSNGFPGNDHQGHSHNPMSDDSEMIATVAYMIVFGDGLHNFIDGLVIGASFTSSIYQGISTSIAVLCEEYPHELGDFAILLNSGMSIKQAVFANFLSACTCYLGLILGIVLGENFQATEWIFALAGGMFLYISLVDMLPEINNVGGGDPYHKDQRSFGILLLQNAGMLTGFGIMLVLELFAENIEL